MITQRSMVSSQSTRVHRGNHFRLLANVKARVLLDLGARSGAAEIQTVPLVAASDADVGRERLVHREGPPEVPGDVGIPALDPLGIDQLVKVSRVDVAVLIA